MKLGIKSFGVVGAVAGLMLLLPGCPGPDYGNDGGTPTDGGTDGGSGFTQPANTTALNFTIDATARAGEFEDGDLEWKGSWVYDEATRTITAFDDTWPGPEIPLYDDGPWTAGGHEPAGSVANDDKFGVTVFFPHQSIETTFRYGAQTKEGGWIWPESENGTLVVAPGAAGPLTAAGFTMLPVGNVDVKIVINSGNLESGFTAAGPYQIKGTLTSGPWNLASAYDDGTHGDEVSGDGNFTYVLSEDEANPSLVASGSTQQFVWVIDGAEYKAGGAASDVGVTAFTKGPSATEWTAATISKVGTDQNTAIVIP